MCQLLLSDEVSASEESFLLQMGNRVSHGMELRNRSSIRTSGLAEIP